MRLSRIYPLWIYQEMRNKNNLAELFVKIVKALKPLIIFAKSFILDASQGFQL